MKLQHKINLKCIALIVAIIISGSLMSQGAMKRTGIIHIDSRGWGDDASITQLARIELGKLNLYDVIDRYDVEDMLKKNNKKASDCLGKDCIIECGKLLKADYMVSGSVEKFSDKVLVMFREIDVVTGSTTKTVVKDYPDVSIEPEVMIEVALKEMYNIAITDPNKQNLDKKNTINTAVTNPEDATISIGGPRFGMAFFTGSTAEFFKRDKSQGGYGGYPAAFQFGYQFEKMYLNEGNLQALVEFIPSFTGMDQGLLSPSFTLLNGFRSAKGGWEFAFGPTITWTKVTTGYNTADGAWHLPGEWTDTTGNPNPIVTKSDTRGNLVWKPGLLIGVGKTFKSGRLNMPLNFYLVPRRGSLQFGVSYGFNAMKSN
jgi:hypothetical protein